MAVKASFPFRPEFHFRNSQTGQSIIYQNPELYRFLHDLWKRTGGHDDLVDSSAETEPPFTSGDMIELDNDIESFEYTQYIPKTFNGVTITQNYTALAFEMLAVTRQATINLPANPDDNDQVIVINVNGKIVTVKGNGKYINDDTETISRRKNTGIVYQYFIDLDKWFMR